MWTSGKKFFWSWRKQRRERLSPFLLSCVRASSKSSLLAIKKSAPRTLVCYAAVLVSSCSFPERCVTTLKGCVADYSYSVNDLINARGVYLILKVQVGGVYHVGGVYFYNCITLTSSTKLVCFRRKLQEGSKIVELMRLGSLEIHTALSNSNIDFRILA